MFIDDITNFKVTEKIDVKCDDCGVTYNRLLKQLKHARKVRGVDIDYCPTCSRLRGAKKRPQNSKDFWEKNKQSDAYYESLKNRPSVSGENNPMFGKTFSPESKAKRSLIWQQRTGERATNWKGGKLSLNKRVKSALQRKYKWFHRVMDRDNCTCQHCGATKKLDAHHIEPISGIIKLLLEEQEFLTEKEKIDWLIIQPSIVDNELKNGKTLCRTCHRKVHQNWGSHESKVQ